jgi:hypothetical protein
VVLVEFDGEAVEIVMWLSQSAPYPVAADREHVDPLGIDSVLDGGAGERGGRPADG